MAEFLDADKRESTLLVLFIPSVDREENPIDHEAWVISALKMLGLHFAGATAFPQGQGVWRDDARGGVLVFDEPTVIQCYTSETTLEANKLVLRDFLVQLGTQTKQGAVGFVVDRVYFEFRFP